MCELPAHCQEEKQKPLEERFWGAVQAHVTLLWKEAVQTEQ